MTVQPSALRLLACAAVVLTGCSPSIDEVNERVGSEVRAELPQLLGVDALPQSVRELQCRGVNERCTENVYAAQCAFALDPADFGQLFDPQELVSDPYQEPSGGAHSYFDRAIGADFETGSIYGGTPSGVGVTLHTNRARDRVLVHFVQEMDIDCD